jgi:multidrug resistance efflux pump
MKVKPQIILLIIISFIVSCKPKTAENLEEMARRSSRPEAVLVKTVKLEPSTFYHELVSNGKAYSSEKAVIPFKVNGTIKELAVRNGQKVKAGQLLAVIDDFEFRSQLESARQNFEKAEINFKDDLYSKYVTFDTTILSPEKIKTSRTRSGLNDAVTALNLAEYNFNNTRIHSPISGVVANLEALQWNPARTIKPLHYYSG